MESPTVSKNGSSSFYNERQGHCSICSENDVKLVNLSKNCKHLSNCCVPCLTQSISTDIESKGAYSFQCPMPACNIKFEPEEYYQLLDKRLVGIVDKLLLHRILEINEEFRWCKSSKGCGAGQLVSNHKDLLGYYACYACGEMLCFRHSIEWHKGFTCDEFDAERARNDDLASDVTVLAFTKKCPNALCATPIMKHEGCDVMTCCRFGTHNEEPNGYFLKSNQTDSNDKKNIKRNLDNKQLQDDQIDSHQRYNEQSNSFPNNENVHSLKSTRSVVNSSTDMEHDYVSIPNSQILSDEMLKKPQTSNNKLKNDETIDKFQYNRSISLNPEYHQSQEANLHKRTSLTINLQNTRDQSRESIKNKTIIKHIQENNLLSIESTNNNNKLNTEQYEQTKPISDDYSPIRRLLEPNCAGIRSRIELLGQLISSKKLDSIPNEYDQMKDIIAAIERNDRFQSDSDGKYLHHLTNAAKSNLNSDLNNLDDEIHRQFGLHSVEVTGDGACAFRATLISGLHKPDVYHSELRERAIQQVLNNIDYYSTVLRPGEKVSEKELKDWANSMADPNTYGDEMANMAIVDKYHIQLVIFRAGELLTVVNPRDGYVEHTAFLVNVGTHYKALVPGYELEEARRNSERLSKKT
ncbi:unnamed protein product [Rotaria sp. Silwood1]|nr:unnamed protein product [Rotaria sp. Silwood1]